MALRKMLNGNPAALAGLAFVLIALAVILSRGGDQLPEVQPITAAWYYNLDTGELFSGPMEPAPIDAPGGSGQAVRAHLFSCGACTEQERFIGFLTRHTPEAARVLTGLEAGANPTPDEQVILETGQRIGAAPDAPGKTIHWAVEGTPEADAVRTAPAQQCGGMRPTRCAAVIE